MKFVFSGEKTIKTPLASEKNKTKQNGEMLLDVSCVSL